MARVAMGAKALQVFAGGLNRLSVWAKHLNDGCCGPDVTPKIDRLNPTINPENALVHTSPYGHRDFWEFANGKVTDREDIIKTINTEGIGAQIELMVIPTFTLLTSVHVAVLAAEPGLAFKLVTRNGTVLPSDQLIKVTETDGGTTCGEVERVQGAADLANIPMTLGAATREHHIGVAGNGGNFALEADVLILEVISVPADPVVGFFNVHVHANYIAPGRSEAAR